MGFGARIVADVCRELLPRVAVTVAGVSVATAAVPIGKLMIPEPSGTVTLAGTVRDGLLESVTAIPPAGAGLLIRIRPVKGVLPWTVDRLTERLPSV